MRRLDELYLEHTFYGSRQMVRHLRREGTVVGRVVSVNCLFRRRQLELPVFGARNAASKILISPVVVEPVDMWGTAQRLSTYPQAARRARTRPPVSYCGHDSSALASFLPRADRVRWCAASAR